jgi:hypothetical protein
MVSEEHPLTSESVNVRCVEFLLSVAAQITITEIIGKDEDNIWQWFLFGLVCARYKRKGCINGRCNTVFHNNFRY